MNTADSQSRDFLWGAATAAHQIEGHQRNNWTEWEKDHIEDWMATAESRYGDIPAWPKVKTQAEERSNYINGLACDHFRRYPEDIALMQELELNSFRFSIEWSRIEPKPGKFDKAAVEHYRQVLLALHEAGITPFVSLHHFSDPTWLEAAGGWHGREFPELFARYARYVSTELGDLVEFWATFNEPESYLISRYLGSPLWPGWPHQEKSFLKYLLARRRFVAAHKAAYRVMKRQRPLAQIGFTHSIVLFEAGNWWLKPVAWALDYNGGSGKFRHTKGAQDFLGVQYYTRAHFRARVARLRQWEVPAPAEQRSDFGWEIYPEGLYKITQKLKRYGLPMYITENGIADAEDKRRADFITRHVAAMQRSMADGADIRGYFYWSLLDNYEWSTGYWPRFGLVQVDRQDQKRTIRTSAYVYRDIIRKN
ncbi:MAG: glycoside hydrolase family 1 protein [Candidatus Saccharimonadales bacterium]